eukprot:scaffold151720_cov39-Tisochrysis_lutea.AAC.2
MVLGWLGPRVSRRARRASSYNVIASSVLPLACNRPARLLIEVRVLGCCAPSTSRLISNASWQSSIASSICPWAFRSIARLFMDVSVLW